MSIDPIDRIAQRLDAMKRGDASEAPPVRDVQPNFKGSAPPIGKRREHPIPPPEIPASWGTTTSAARRVVTSAPEITESTTEGSSTEMTTATKPKGRGHNLRRTSKATAKSKTPTKVAAAKNGAVSDLDTRALPFVIHWKSTDGTFVGKSLTGDWGNARYRIKGYLDKTHKADDVRAGLTAALEAVREGRSFKIHDVQIDCTSR